jgi:hypothetical protein
MCKDRAGGKFRPNEFQRFAKAGMLRRPVETGSSTTKRQFPEDGTPERTAPIRYRIMVLY